MSMTSGYRQAFHEDLKALEQELIEMASLSEGQVADSVEALLNLNIELAEQVIKNDDLIDVRDMEIEQHCLRILALQQPMAKDLRTVGVIMKMTTDVERIGDLGTDIASIAIKLSRLMVDSIPIDIAKMGALARKMFRESIEAFVKRNLETVDMVVRSDDEMDQLFRDYRKQIVELMKKYPDRFEEASFLLMVVMHLERIADHAVNIAERVFFMETAKLAKFDTREPYPHEEI